MSIERYFKRIIKKDTAVYWSPTATKTAAAVPVYNAPVDIGCFWNEKIQTLLDDSGEEFISKATVWVAQDLAEDGYLFHGALTDLSAAQKADPRKVQDAYVIKLFFKSPSLRFGHNRKAIL